MTENNKIIVIFEDNPSISQLLTFFFQKRGYDPRVFEDGTEAARHVRENSPILIMMDMIMPGVDGIEACQEIRREGIATPILMLTSKAFEADRENALAAGASGYLLKPFNPTALEAAIKPLLPI
jgi:DNA-binding response OmpR family regulator